MSSIVETVVKLRRNGHLVVIVSSGGIAVGLRRMGLSKRPKLMATTQAIASIGQARLIGFWDDLFRQLEQPIGQILLTRNDILDYLNAANTIHELLNLGVVPIINENDTLTVDEIKFGDNDTLSALVAGMISADYLFLMTDVDCLYSENPRVNPHATPIVEVRSIPDLKVNVGSAGSDVGTGGMTTKLIAAGLATAAGVHTVICRSSIPGNVHKIVEYVQQREDAAEPLSPQEELQRLTDSDTPLHTRFIASQQVISDRKFWILFGLPAMGSILIDPGAREAITRSNRAGLLPVGVLAVQGTFHASQCVNIYAAERSAAEVSPESSQLVGKAIVNYSSIELELVKGLQSSEISKALGYAGKCAIECCSTNRLRVCGVP